MKKILFILPILFIGLAVFFIYRSTQKQEIILNGYIFKVSNFNRDYQIYDITNQKKLISKDSAKIHTLGLPDGNYKLLFSSPNRKDINIEINNSTNNTFTINFEKVSEDIDDMQTLLGQTTGVVVDAKYFSNKTWLLGYLAYDVESSSSYELKILKKSGSEWVSVIAGTDLNSDYLKLLGAPSDLIEYLESR